VLSFYYDSTAQTLTDALGTESYDARNLSAIGVLPPPPLEPAQVSQEQPQGSWFWWPVMLGGGAALLVAAVWLRRMETTRG
jgi:hypothetical protein